MQWQIFPIEKYPFELWVDWQKIVAEHHHSNPMLSSSFVILLVDFFGNNLHVAQGKVNGNLVALILLEKSGKGIWRCFKPSQSQLALLVLDKNHPSKLFDLLAQIPGKCLKLDFFSIDPFEHSSILAEVRASNVEEYAINIRIGINGEFDDYWSNRPKKLRQNIKRYQNRIIRELGDCRFEIISDEEGVVNATDRYGMLEVKGWKGRLGTALHPSNKQGQLYRQYIKKMANDRKAIVFELYLGSELVASRLCVYSDALLVTLKTTFDEDFKKHAVGRILLKEVLAFIFDNKLVPEIDFYTNATNDQIDWSTEQRPMYNVSVYRNQFTDRLAPKLLMLKRNLTKLFQKESHT